MTRPLLDDWKAEHRAERLELARRAEEELARLQNPQGPLAVACLGISLRHRLAALCYSDPLPRLLELALAEATCANCACSLPGTDLPLGQYVDCCLDPEGIIIMAHSDFCSGWKPRK